MTTTVGDPLSVWFQTSPDARTAFMLDGDFHALVWQVRADYDGRPFPIGVLDELDAEAAEALERVYDRQDRAREAARRPLGPTAIPPLFDATEGPR